jgi:hypothetical protein
LEINWDTQSGRALRQLAIALREKEVVPDEPITVFGSAPLQLLVDPLILSGDIDITVSQHREQIKAIIDEIGFGKGKAAYYIEVVPSYVFRPGDNWLGRSQVVELEGVRFRIPDPLDILLAKLRRMEVKDLRAFEAVRRKTGRPTEDELLDELRAVSDLFYLQKSAEKSVLWTNTEKLWPQFYGRPIDVRKEILKPVFDAIIEQNGDTEYLRDIRASLGLN